MAAPLFSQRSRRDLRGFLELLEQRGRLRRITAPVDPDLELAAIADRVLSLGGPALLFENVIGSTMPVAVNLLGTQERVLWSMGMEQPEELERLGERLALLQQPRPPKGAREAVRFGSVLLDVLKARPDLDLTPPCHQQVFKGEAVNLDALPLLRLPGHQRVLAHCGKNRLTTLPSKLRAWQPFRAEDWVCPPWAWALGSSSARDHRI